jgi:hypothetical protein
MLTKSRAFVGGTPMHLVTRSERAKGFGSELMWPDMVAGNFTSKGSFSTAKVCRPADRRSLHGLPVQSVQQVNISSTSSEGSP